MKYISPTLIGLSLAFRLNAQEPALNPESSTGKPSFDPPFRAQPRAPMAIPLVHKENHPRSGRPQNASLTHIVFGTAAHGSRIDYLEVQADKSTPYYRRGESTWLTPHDLFTHYKFVG